MKLLEKVGTIKKFEYSLLGKELKHQLTLQKTNIKFQMFKKCYLQQSKRW